MSPSWFDYFVLFLSFVAIFASFLAVRASAAAFRQASIRELKSKSIRRLTGIETELTEHADSIMSLHDSLKKLRSRIGMRNLRTKRDQEAADMPDSRENPAEWKRAMRIRLMQTKKQG